MFIEELSGPDVVVIDNTDAEVKSLLETLDKHDIKNEYVKVDLAGDNDHRELIKTVKLVFLDLYYGPPFDPGFCANLISEIVPPNKQYYLVAWTQDPDKTDLVIEELQLLNLAPVAYVSKLKDDYRQGDNYYDIEKLLKELDFYFDQIKEVNEYYGLILEVEDSDVLIKCSMLRENQKPVFQVRRFDKSLFENYIEVKPGSYIVIRSITKPGSRLFEFSSGSNTLAKYFEREDEYFKNIDPSTLFDTE